MEVTNSNISFIQLYIGDNKFIIKDKFNGTILQTKINNQWNQLQLPNKWALKTLFHPLRLKVT